MQAMMVAVLRHEAEQIPLRSMPGANLQLGLGWPVSLVFLSLDADGNGALQEGIVVCVVDGQRR